MDVTLYGLKSCDTCRKAIKELGDAGHRVGFVDVRADGVAADKISGWIAAHGVGTVLNTRSTTWRALDEAARAGADTTDGAVALIREHPALMKRPVIEADGKSHVGWSAAVQAALK